MAQILLCFSMKRTEHYLLEEVKDYLIKEFDFSSQSTFPDNGYINLPDNCLITSNYTPKEIVKLLKQTAKHFKVLIPRYLVIPISTDIQWGQKYNKVELNQEE